MEFCILDNYNKMSIKAADFVTAQLRDKPDSVLGFASGSTPIGMYNELVNRYNNGMLSFKNAVGFNLDEYKDLPANHPQSYKYYMDKYLYSHIDIAMDKTFIPDGLGEDSDTVCKKYDELLNKHGPIDCQILPSMQIKDSLIQ